MAALIKAVNWTSALYYPREGYAFLEQSDSPLAKAVVAAVGASWAAAAEPQGREGGADRALIFTLQPPLATLLQTAP